MIQYIKGTLTDMDAESVTIDHQGIGLQVFISNQTAAALPALGAEVMLYTYFQVKDDGFSLFGFLSKDDLRVFQLLLGVGGIGPKGALAVLSALTPDELRFAVLAEDAAAITKAPGIGKKTAQRVILELKDKMKLEDTWTGQQSSTANPLLALEKGVRQEAQLALTALGYTASEAAQVLAGIEITPESSVEDILKCALKNMAFL